MSDFTKLRLRQLYIESCSLMRKYDHKMPASFIAKYSPNIRLKQYRKLETGTKSATVINITDRR